MASLLFHRGYYNVVYMTPEFCSGNLLWLEELENSIGKL